MLSNSEGLVMFYRTRINNEPSKRHYDPNGFLFVDESPVMSTDVLEYLGSELTGSDKPQDVCGVIVEPDKIYKVRVPQDELEKAAHTFELLPLVNGHQWLSGSGSDGDARKYQEGTTGERAEVKDGKLFVPLKFTGKEILQRLKDGVEELSASYEHSLRRDDSGKADFVAFDLTGNHIALVEHGRCGSGVRVFNREIKMKAKNEIFLVVDGKKVDLARFLAEEQKEGEHDDSISDNLDRREIIREIMAIAAKPAEEFKGGEEERERTIAGLAEKLAYEDDGKETDNEKKTCSENEDEIDVKEKKDEDGSEEEDAKIKASNAAALVAAMRADIAKQEAAKRRAYNEAVALIGEDFNAVGMSEAEILKTALVKKGVAVSNESIAEMRSMIKAVKTIRVDNHFAPSVDTAAKDEVQINI